MFETWRSTVFSLIESPRAMAATSSAPSNGLERKAIAPRWSILTGKLVALVPILWLIGAAGLMLPWFTVFGRLASEHPSVLTDSLIGSAFGAIGLAAITTALTTLAPKHGTSLSITYLLFVDGTLSHFDAKISNVSVLFHSRQLALATSEGAGTAIGWILGLAAFWMMIAVWRVRRLE